ncbi:MAG: holliday junction helicase RuvA [Clostridiales bacterium]|jgi:Holliday junction DNA helicase RuvA|nr:holliday junction helicase RuvA [Clostridiales bacterium]
MLAYLDGLIEHKSSNYVIIDVNGIGFKVYATTKILADMPDVKSRTRLYVHWHIGEGNMALFGFASEQQVDMFESLISVSGVGPKGALALMDALSYEQILLAIVQGDEKSLSRAKGIGAKTAQRIIMELKDKLHMPSEIKSSDIGERIDESTYGQAVEALISLGYAPAEAARVLEGVTTDGRSLEEVIKEALRRF